MIHLHFTAADLTRVRFAVSPLMETVASLRTLAARRQGRHLHRPWIDRFAERAGRLRERDLDLLRALVRPEGYIPDFLVPRGLGRLWEEHPEQTGSALAGVLGHTRAALLAQLDLPMSTTQAATQMALSAPTLSVHLQALRAVGLLTSRREGRQVLYSRTELGGRLLSEAGRRPDA
ncbi:hypothetical protein Pth03_57490 [Planotetraspora thailandica]|uniref:HTH arsR-type domain-containing protein n=1 Tax=Planotetraspora thailandica TaxID=487172 RepID=A0A8J3VFA3_9ACTN|nr:winged helix-turn-helix domain-containing protein [Planotetraspora thailandica]GII57360.1 hypothetical protein Pth03_57490 [Planotetraspora thailandica]